MEHPGTWVPLNLPMDLIQCQIVQDLKADKIQYGYQYKDL